LAAQMNSLARIAGWLRLRTPSSSDEFPYRLGLRDTDRGKAAGTTVHGGRSYKLMLERVGDTVPASFEPRWVYVFVIDSYGKTTLVFPRQGTLGNLLPNERNEDGSLRFSPEIVLTKDKYDLQIDSPYGVDNYFLLTTSQPLENPGDLFDGGGVRTRSARVPSSPLERLIMTVREGVRGAVSGIPTSWSVDHRAILSVPPEASGAGRSK
jgi:hypothetical protein